MTTPSPSPHVQSLHSQKVGSAVQGAAALLWLPQAALLAWAVQGLASGRGLAAVWWPAGGILVLGLLRAACEAWGARRVFAQARAHLSILRAHAAAALAAGSPLDRARVPSGLAASVIAEQAEAVVPYLVRYQPARWRVMVVPLAIATVVAGLSWVAALVLLVAAPLIPVFMAFVGMSAQAAIKAQMLEMGSMNAFLLDVCADLQPCVRWTRWMRLRSVWANPRSRCGDAPWLYCASRSCRRPCSNCSPRSASRWWLRMWDSIYWAR
jgi:ATP-binding cassette subfamily C protein CydD